MNVTLGHLFAPIVLSSERRVQPAIGIQIVWKIDVWVISIRVWVNVSALLSFITMSDNLVVYKKHNLF